MGESKVSKSEEIQLQKILRDGMILEEVNETWRECKVDFLVAVIVGIKVWKK